jgi:hypothetical protein
VARNRVGCCSTLLTSPLPTRDACHAANDYMRSFAKMQIHLCEKTNLARAESISYTRKHVPHLMFRVAKFFFMLTVSELWRTQT